MKNDIPERVIKNIYKNAEQHIVKYLMTSLKY